MFKATFLNMSNDQFHWSIMINGEFFEYHTGMGHGINLAKSKIFSINEVKNNNPGKEFIMAEKNIIAFVPKMDDVLYCLFSDADCGDYTFKEFCDMLGYSDDSISALKTYLLCQENGKKLRRALGDKYNSEKIRIDELNQ